MRFQAAHKLVTYLLVASALAALASTGRLGLASALVFLAACATSFGVDPGTRWAAALDRVAPAIRAAAALLFLALVWRMWRRLPDPELGPVFDLVLAPVAYKLFHRRAHRDYIHVLALSLLVVLVAAALARTFLFLAAFGVYVLLGTWALVLFHLRREMEENYLVKHSAQAPSQKVGVGRILGSRRVVGRAFFGVTAAVAAAVCLGAIGIFMLVP
jgi:Mg2+/citrate symporter